MDDRDIEDIEITYTHEKLNKDSGDTESAHWEAVMRSFMYYKSYTTQLLEYKASRIDSLSIEYKKLLPKPSSLLSFDQYIPAIENNSRFCLSIVSCQDIFLEPRDSDTYNFTKTLPFISDNEMNIPASMLERCKAVLHSAYREWSREGEEERKQCHTPILQQLAKWLPITSKNKYKQCICVPGAGLSRLAADICSEGYRVQANEYSVFMLMASNYILNYCSEPLSQEIYPWIGGTTNVKRLKNVLQKILVPDVNPEKLITITDVNMEEEDDDDDSDSNDDDNNNNKEGGRQEIPVFSLAAGDFVQVYGPSSPCARSSQGRWSGVVTCFFIDTAPNLIDYVKTIHHMLEEEGVWINLGPLQYHWASEEAPASISGSGSGDNRYDRSIELSFEDVLIVLQNAGFELLEQDWHECSYALDGNCMRRTIYDCGLFTVRKA